MFITSVSSRLYKIIATVVLCAFCMETAVFAIPDTLAPAPGRSQVYEAMQLTMESKVDAHDRAELNTFVSRQSDRSRPISGDLKKEFNKAIEDSKVPNALTILQATLRAQGGRIQTISFKDESDLPEISGKKVWGHAGESVTAFYINGDENSPEGRRRIIARLFVQMRNRSTIGERGEEFEAANQNIANEILNNGYITDAKLAAEFGGMTFYNNKKEVSAAPPENKSEKIGTPPAAPPEENIPAPEPSSVSIERHKPIMIFLVWMPLIAKLWKACHPFVSGIVRKFRQLYFERLETREVLSSVQPVTADELLNPMDINGDGYVTAIDVLLLSNELARLNGVPVSQRPAPGRMDIDRNGVLAPLDSLIIINAINTGENLVINAAKDGNLFTADFAELRSAPSGEKAPSFIINRRLESGVIIPVRDGVPAYGEFTGTYRFYDGLLYVVINYPGVNYREDYGLIFLKDPQSRGNFIHAGSIQYVSAAAPDPSAPSLKLTAQFFASPLSADIQNRMNAEIFNRFSSAARDEVSSQASFAVTLAPEYFVRIFDAMRLKASAGDYAPLPASADPFSGLRTFWNELPDSQKRRMADAVEKWWAATDKASVANQAILIKALSAIRLADSGAMDVLGRLTTALLDSMRQSRDYASRASLIAILCSQSAPVIPNLITHPGINEGIKSKLITALIAECRANPFLFANAADTAARIMSSIATSASAAGAPGHLASVSAWASDYCAIIRQNPGAYSPGAVLSVYSTIGTEYFDASAVENIRSYADARLKGAPMPLALYPYFMSLPITREQRLAVEARIAPGGAESPGVFSALSPADVAAMFEYASESPLSFSSVTAEENFYRQISAYFNDPAKAIDTVYQPFLKILRAVKQSADFARVSAVLDPVLLRMNPAARQSPAAVSKLLSLWHDAGVMVYDPSGFIMTGFLRAGGGDYAAGYKDYLDLFGMVAGKGGDSMGYGYWTDAIALTNDSYRASASGGVIKMDVNNVYRKPDQIVDTLLHEGGHCLEDFAQNSNSSQLKSYVAAASAMQAGIFEGSDSTISNGPDYIDSYQASRGEFTSVEMEVVNWDTAAYLKKAASVFSPEHPNFITASFYAAMLRGYLDPGFAGKMAVYKVSSRSDGSVAGVSVRSVPVSWQGAAGNGQASFTLDGISYSLRMANGIVSSVGGAEKKAAPAIRISNVIYSAAPGETVTIKLGPERDNNGRLLNYFIPLSLFTNASFVSQAMETIPGSQANSAIFSRAGFSYIRVRITSPPGAISSNQFIYTVKSDYASASARCEVVALPYASAPKAYQPEADMVFSQIGEDAPAEFPGAEPLVYHPPSGSSGGNLNTDISKAIGLYNEGINLEKKLKYIEALEKYKNAIRIGMRVLETFVRFKSSSDAEREKLIEETEDGTTDDSDMSQGQLKQLQDVIAAARERVRSLEMNSSAAEEAIPDKILENWRRQIVKMLDILEGTDNNIRNVSALRLNLISLKNSILSGQPRNTITISRIDEVIDNASEIFFQIDFTMRHPDSAPHAASESYVFTRLADIITDVLSEARFWKAFSQNEEGTKFMGSAAQIIAEQKILSLTAAGKKLNPDMSEKLSRLVEEFPSSAMPYAQDYDIYGSSHDFINDEILNQLRSIGFSENDRSYRRVETAIDIIKKEIKSGLWLLEPVYARYALEKARGLLSGSVQTDPKVAGLRSAISQAIGITQNMPERFPYSCAVDRGAVKDRMLNLSAALQSLIRTYGDTDDESAGKALGLIKDAYAVVNKVQDSPIFTSSGGRYRITNNMRPLIKRLAKMYEDLRSIKVPLRFAKGPNYNKQGLRELGEKYILKFHTGQIDQYDLYWAMEYFEGLFEYAHIVRDGLIAAGKKKYRPSIGKLSRLLDSSVGFYSDIRGFSRLTEAAGVKSYGVSNGCQVLALKNLWDYSNKNDRTAEAAIPLIEKIKSFPGNVFSADKLPEDSDLDRWFRSAWDDYMEIFLPHAKERAIYEGKRAEDIISEIDLYGEAKVVAGMLRGMESDARSGYWAFGMEYAYMILQSVKSAINERRSDITAENRDEVIKRIDGLLEAWTDGYSMNRSYRKSARSVSPDIENMREMNMGLERLKDDLAEKFGDARLAEMVGRAVIATGSEADKFCLDPFEALGLPPRTIGGNATFLFSEHVTFKAGMALMLEKFFKYHPSDIIAVIARDQAERSFIDGLNGKIGSADRKIVAVDSLGAMMNMGHGCRIFYFRMDSDPEDGIKDDNITILDMTSIVKKITGALGALAKIADQEKLRLFNEAARKFDTSA